MILREVGIRELLQFLQQLHQLLPGPAQVRHLFSDLSKPLLVGPEDLLDVPGIPADMVEKLGFGNLIMGAAGYIPLQWMIALLAVIQDIRPNY